MLKKKVDGKVILPSMPMSARAKSGKAGLIEDKGAEETKDSDRPNPLPESRLNLDTKMSGAHLSDQEEPFYTPQEGQADGTDPEVQPAVELGDEKTLMQSNEIEDDGQIEGRVSVEPDTAHDFTDLYEIGEGLQ